MVHPLPLVVCAYIARSQVHNNPYAQQMESAEQGAKNQKLGVWENYDPDAERRVTPATAPCAALRQHPVQPTL